MSPHCIAEKRPKPYAVLSSTPSDSHTWNLLFVQMLMEENGWSVTNLGACVPVAMLMDESLRRVPDMIVLSTVNGHGAQEARQVIAALRAQPSLARVPVALGGKLCVSEDRERAVVDELVAAGFDAVLVGDTAVPVFRSLLTRAAAMPGRHAGRRA
ncbi:cobalamin B12-binding domain-containing protein [Sphaerisporangium corydalis]|uniref:Cobalamin B12-binding domain-containing protein n=1 Tax=Sphaerisporangium corydalis TaxID=1441875 RepID=A0ABV9ERX4_9ACTN|nr:cobalamin-dependent protein [Sphaerisporangium corydalis]